MKVDLDAARRIEQSVNASLIRRDLVKMFRDMILEIEELRAERKAFSDAHQTVSPFEDVD